MQNRWFHKPELHSPATGHERKVGWLELFYDLVYVAAIIQLGNALGKHVDVYGFLAFAGVFIPMWMAWTDFTFYNNRFIVDDFLHRAMVFAQMFGIGAMAVSVNGVLDGEYQNFLMAFAFVRVLLTLMMFRAWFQLPAVRPMTGPMTWFHALGSAFWVAAAVVPGPWNALLGLMAVVVDAGAKIAPVKLSEIAQRYPPDALHLSERYGLLTIIVLGESFVKVLSLLSDPKTEMTTSVIGMAGLTLAITFSLWWIYFDDVAGSRIRRTRLASVTWIWLHLPLTLAITGVGVAVKKAVLFDPMTYAKPHYRWLLAGTLALALLSVAGIDAVTERRQSELSDRARTMLRAGAALLVLLVAVVGGSMSALTFVALLSGVCVLQVFADLSMAPLADPHAAHEEEHALWDAPLHDEEEPEEEPERRSLATVDSAVRKGVPNAFRRDLYYHFMEGSWTRMFFTVAVVWVLSNVAFGALYLLEPGSVSSVHDDSFLEAFSFSVQTMSSIGYGVMAPQTQYAHVLVAVEAFLGLIGIALATGLVFAKASRPSMSVMFSKYAVIHERDGRRTLEFRVGNARGTEVVEASIYVAALVDEISPEGHTLRKLHDLKLTRSMTPMFALTWSVMHPIDEDSPLYGLDEEACRAHIASLICTLTGHDATYGQTTHARHLYDPADLRFDHDFADVISTLPDGRLLVDFGHFHDVKRVVKTAEVSESPTT